jgi:hypothetical protein
MAVKKVYWKVVQKVVHLVEWKVDQMDDYLVVLMVAWKECS